MQHFFFFSLDTTYHFGVSLVFYFFLVIFFTFLALLTDDVCDKDDDDAGNGMMMTSLRVEHTQRAAEVEAGVGVCLLLLPCSSSCPASSASHLG